MPPTTSSSPHTPYFAGKRMFAWRKVAGRLKSWMKNRSSSDSELSSASAGSRMWSTSEGGGLVICKSGGNQVAMPLAEMRHHAHLLGPTGVGKTTVLERTFLDAVLDQGIGAGYIDAGDGGAIDRILERIPVDEWNRVVLIDPTHPGWAVSFNPLDRQAPGQQADVADQMVAILRGQLERLGWGDRMDEVMRAAVLTLMRYPGATLCDLPPLLMDQVARARWTQYLDDRFGLSRFWAEYEQQALLGYIPGVTPALGKLHNLLLHPHVRVILGQSEPSLDLLDLEEILDGRGILLANFSKVRLGEEASSFLGSFLLLRIWQAIRHRAAIPEQERPDFWQVIDEFQTLAHSFENIGVDLTESGRLRMGWALAHRYPEELSERMWTAIEANTRTKIYFSGTDPSLLKGAQLGEHQAMVTLGDNAPVVGTTLPPSQSFGTWHAEELIAHSFELWGRPWAEVEAELVARRW